MSVACPFCGKICLETVDPSRFPPDMPFDEGQKIAQKILMNEFREPCEHVAVRTNSVDYGNVEEKWKALMTSLADALEEGSNFRDLGVIISQRTSEIEEVNETAKSVLVDHDFKIEVWKPEWGCVSPTYIFIFCKMKG